MEFLDYYNEEGEFIGTATRKKVHEDGLWHKTIHCWLYDSEGNVFFQIRHDRKTLYTTASGHILAGETLQEGFKREIKEEIGIDLDTSNATLVCAKDWRMDKVKKDGSVFKDRVFANVYLNEYDGDYSDFNFDPEEVDGLVLVNAKETIKLFNDEISLISGKIITSEGVSEKDITKEDFLLNEGETLLEKYGEILSKVIEIIN